MEPRKFATSSSLFTVSTTTPRTLFTPVIVRRGAILPLAVRECTVIVPTLEFPTTSSSFTVSTAIPERPLSPVAAPEIVRMGAMSPPALSGYTLMLVACATTSSLFTVSTAAPLALTSPVAAPLSLRMGETFPFAVRLCTRMAPPLRFAANSSPWPQATRGQSPSPESAASARTRVTSSTCREPAIGRMEASGTEFVDGPWCVRPSW
jgi:hypothetical protein